MVETSNIVTQAWRDADFFFALTQAERKALPLNPAGKLVTSLERSGVAERSTLINATCDTLVSGCCSTLVSHTCDTLISGCCGT